MCVSVVPERVACRRGGGRQGAAPAKGRSPMESPLSRPSAAVPAPRELGPDDPTRVGRYRIEARIGEGGMGAVYLGRDPGGRAVAVKVVRPDLAGDRMF